MYTDSDVQQRGVIMRWRRTWCVDAFLLQEQLKVSQGIFLFWIQMPKVAMRKAILSTSRAPGGLDLLSCTGSLGFGTHDGGVEVGALIGGGAGSHRTW